MVDIVDATDAKVNLLDDTDSESTSVNPLDEGKPNVNPVDEPKSTLSTRVDTRIKGRFIRKAGEEGSTPSETLRKLVDEYVNEGSTSAKGGRVDEVLAFMRDVGRHRMENCEEAEVGENTGKLICWYWRFSEGDEASMENLDLVPIKEDGKVKYYHAEATPELCGACHAYDAVNELGPAIRELKESIWGSEKK